METTVDKRFTVRKLDSKTWSIYDNGNNPLAVLLREGSYVRNNENKIARWNKYETCRAVCDRLNTQ